MVVKSLARLASFTLMAIFFIIRPLLGPAECKYGLSCMPFARKQLTELPLHTALWRIVRRVVSCIAWVEPRKDLMI